LLQTTNFVIEGCEITNALLSHFSYLCRGKNRNRDQRSRNYKGQAESALQQQQNFPLFLDSHKPVWPCGRRFFWNGRVQILVFVLFVRTTHAGLNKFLLPARPSIRQVSRPSAVHSPAHYFRYSLSHSWPFPSTLLQV